MAALPLSSGTPAHLRHHHECMLIGSEVGIVEHRVGIEDAYHRHAVEVQSLRNHLRADEHIGSPRGKVTDEPLVGVARASGVEVHASNAGFGEEIAQLVFNLLGAIAAASQVGAFARRTTRGHGVGVAAIMAGQRVRILVQRQRHIAVFASRHPAAGVALHHRRKATAVLEEDDLLLIVERLSHGRQQLRREWA